MFLDRRCDRLRARHAGRRAGQRLRAGHPRHAGQPAAGRLADAQPHLRRAALQSARPGQPRQCQRAQDGVDARAHRRHPGNHADRRPRGDVCGQPERRRAGAQRHQRRPDLGILARDPQGDGRRHRRADARAHQRPRHLRGPGVLRRARRRPGGARCQDRQDALGDQGSRVQGSDSIDLGADRRRGQGDHRPHLRDAGRLLHRGARRQDRQRALEILSHARARRAGRRFMGQRAARATDCEQLGPAGLLRSGAQGALLGDRQSQAVDPLEASRQHRRRSALGAVRALQQLHRCARRRDRQSGLVLPASAGRRLGPRPYPRANPRSHRHQSRPHGGEVDQSQHSARAGARRGGRGGGGRRHLAARPPPGSSSGRRRSRSTCPSSIFPASTSRPAAPT